MLQNESGLILPWMTFEVILNMIKICVLKNFNILEKFLKDWALNKNYIAEKDDFEILR